MRASTVKIEKELLEKLHENAKSRLMLDKSIS
jgi:hypothetical protein